MRVVSLFCGIGGIDIAFLQEGHEIIWANDNNVYAAKTYIKNNTKASITTQDIRKIAAKDIPEMDILIGGFPCQSFSVMGYQKGFQDPRGNLFFEIVRIVEDKRPRIVFLENVRNLLNHDNGKTFRVIQNILHQLGYLVKHQVLSPHEYADIPQERQRIFIVVFKEKNDYDLFEFPRPIRLIRDIDDIIDRSKKTS